MKKLNKICFLAFILVSSSAINSCGTKENEQFVSANSISFDQLKEIAVEPIYTTQKEYKISGKLLDFNFSSIYSIPCLGSNLVVYRDNGTYKNVLLNVENNKIICDNVYSDGCLEYNYVFQNNMNVYSSASIPIIVYETYDLSEEVITLNYADCYGNTIATERVTSGEYRYLNSFQIKVVNEVSYVCLENGKNNWYFSFKNSDGKYNVMSIYKATYQKVESVADDSKESVEYDDNLTPKYDSNGSIVAYIGNDYNNIFIYDSNKKYLNNIDLSSFGLNYSSTSLYLEKSIYYFQSESYYESQLFKGSKDTYKCKCLEIDLITGKVYYNDDFEYYINYAYNNYDEESFNYSYVTYYELNEKRELSDTLKCVILKDKLTFENSFIYDGFTTNVYNICYDALLAKFGNTYYYVTKDERTPLYGITICNFFENGNVLYVNQDGKYYVCRLVNIKESIKIFNDGKAYLSVDKYNGKNISLDYDEKTYKYYANNHELIDYSYAKNGIYVTSKEIYIGTNKILSLEDTNTINYLTKLTLVDNISLYRVYLSNGSYKYFSYFIEEE